MARFEDLLDVSFVLESGYFGKCHLGWVEFPVFAVRFGINESFFELFVYGLALIVGETGLFVSLL